MKITYNWDAELGIATCTLLYQDTEYVGSAMCHPDDYDFKSELIGSNLAYLRASIKLMQGEKKEKKAELKALKKLYNSLTPSPKFNPKSFETKSLLKHIEILNEDLEILDECISGLRHKISCDIDTGEKFYQGVRKNRKQREEALKEQNDD